MHAVTYWYNIVDVQVLVPYLTSFFEEFSIFIETFFFFSQESILGL